MLSSSLPFTSPHFFTPENHFFSPKNHFFTPKKCILALLLVALMAAQGALAQAPAQDKWTGLTRYEQANRTLQAGSNSGRRVVFMGNSITDLWLTRSPQFWAEHPNYIDRGISGQTTYQMVVRFRQDVIGLQPRVVVIGGGANDIAQNQHIPYNEDLTFGNLVTMCELAKAHKIKVILTSLLPCDNFYWTKQITGVALKIARLNDRLRRYAQEHGITYVDYYTPMKAPDSFALNPAYQHDSVHPNAAGYAVMQRLILPAIRRWVKD